MFCSKTSLNRARGESLLSPFSFVAKKAKSGGGCVFLSLSLVLAFPFQGKAAIIGMGCSGTSCVLNSSSSRQAINVLGGTNSLIINNAVMVESITNQANTTLSLTTNSPSVTYSDRVVVQNLGTINNLYSVSPFSRIFASAPNMGSINGATLKLARNDAVLSLENQTITNGAISLVDANMAVIGTGTIRLNYTGDLKLNDNYKFYAPTLVNLGTLNNFEVSRSMVIDDNTKNKVSVDKISQNSFNQLSGTYTFTNQGTIKKLESLDSGVIPNFTNQKNVTELRNLGTLTNLSNTGTINTFTNQGTITSLTNSGTITNGTISANGNITTITNTGNFTLSNSSSTGKITTYNANSGTTKLTNAGTITNLNLIGGTNIITNNGTITNTTFNNGTNIITNNGTIDASLVFNGGVNAFTNNTSSGTISTMNNNANSQLSLNNKKGTITNFTNKGTMSSLSNAATLTNTDNQKSIATLNNTGTFSSFKNSTGTITSFNNTGSITTLQNNKVITTLNNGSTSTSTSTISTLTNSGSVTNLNNRGTINTFTNNAAGNISSFVNYNDIKSFTNAGTISSLVFATAKDQTITNNNQITDLVLNSGKLTYNGSTANKVTGRLNIEKSATLVMQQTLYAKGDLYNSGSIDSGSIEFQGTTLNNNGQFNANLTSNSDSARITNSSSITNLTNKNANTLSNAGTITTLNNTGTMNSLENANTINTLNNTSGSISSSNNSGTISSLNNSANIESLNNSGTINTLINNNTGNLNLNSNGIVETFTNKGTASLNTSGKITALKNETGATLSSLNNTGTIQTLDNSANIDIFNNTGLIQTFTNESTGNISSFNNIGTISSFTNKGGNIVFVNTGLGKLDTITNAGGVTTIDNQGAKVISVDNQNGIVNYSGNQQASSYDANKGVANVYTFKNDGANSAINVKEASIRVNIGQDNTSYNKPTNDLLANADNGHIVIAGNNASGINFEKGSIVINPLTGENGKFASNKDYELDSLVLYNNNGSVQKAGSKVNGSSSVATKAAGDTPTGLTVDALKVYGGAGTLQIAKGATEGTFRTYVDVSRGAGSVVLQDFIPSEVMRDITMDSLVGLINPNPFFKADPFNPDSFSPVSTKNSKTAKARTASANEKENWDFMVLPYFSSKANNDIKDSSGSVIGQTSGNTYGLIAGLTYTDEQAGLFGAFLSYEKKDSNFASLNSTNIAPNFDFGANTFTGGLRYAYSFLEKDTQRWYVRAGTSASMTNSSIDNNEYGTANTKIYGYTGNLGLSVDFFTDDPYNALTPTVGLGYNGGFMKGFKLGQIAANTTTFKAQYYNLFYANIGLRYQHYFTQLFGASINLGGRKYFNEEYKANIRINGESSKASVKLDPYYNYFNPSLDFNFTQNFKLSVGYHLLQAGGSGLTHTGYLNANYVW